jgi:hypothetical protein
VTCSLCNRYQESESRDIKKSPFSLRDCLCSAILPFGPSAPLGPSCGANFKGGLHHAEDADRRGRILCDAECCRRCRSASQAAAASGACSGWQGSDRQVSSRQSADRQIPDAGARSDQGLTVCFLDARKIERSGYASHFHTYAPLRRGIFHVDWNIRRAEAGFSFGQLSKRYGRDRISNGWRSCRPTI